MEQLVKTMTSDEDKLAKHEREKEARVNAALFKPILISRQFQGRSQKIIESKTSSANVLAYSASVSAEKEDVVWRAPRGLDLLQRRFSKEELLPSRPMGA